MDILATTITARATPPGVGGVGIIRVSGPKVPEIAEKLCGLIPKPRFAYHTVFKDSEGLPIDDGLVLYFKAPHSFTGEDVLELQGHGGQVVLDLLLKRILELGAVLARPGEFSERAFLNGKIDLTQAEAIADLINASSKQSARGAIRSLTGEFSRLIDTLKEKIINLRVNVEALIDFPEEELGIEQHQHFEVLLSDISSLFSKIESHVNQGILLRDGVSIVITGKPNVGKSSLLNALTEEDTAIVTDIPGTTRDVLKTKIQIDGLPIHIIDTAGLQETKDIIEQEGIRRARKEITMADHIFCLVDVSSRFERDPVIDLGELGISLEENNVTVLYNKIDLTELQPALEFIDNIPCIYISAKNHLGIDLLRGYLKASVGFNATSGDLVFSARTRHIDALKKTKEKLLAAKEHLANIELLAEDLTLANQHLGEITGEFSSEDLLNKIFSEFCIGK